MRFLLLPLLLLFPALASAQNFGNIKPYTVLGNPDPTATKPAVPFDAERLSGGARDLISYGGDPTGAADSAAALNACLAGAGSGGTCYAGGTFKLLANINIPANTTLKCADNVPDLEDTPASFGTSPRLLLDSAKSITATAQAARISGCLIVRNGMTFPAADSTAYAGTAVLGDTGSGNFQVINTVIIGFDTCMKFTATRPFVDMVYMDCAGATAGAGALWLANGNTDSGAITRIRIQPLGTGNYHNLTPSTPDCVQSSRAGIGLRNDGINYFGDVVVQNFRQMQVFNSSYLPAEKLWADFIVQCQGTYPGSIGVQNDNTLTVREINLNGTGIGLISNGSTTVQHLFANSIGGDCVKLGVTGSAGNLRIGAYETNAASGNMCGRNGSGYAVNYDPSGHAAYLTIGGGVISKTASTPYMSIPAAVPANQISINDKIVTDLANPAALYGAATVTSCTGIGTGTCSLLASNRTTPWRGTVMLNAVGATAASGSFRLTFPLTGTNGGNCIVSLQNGSAIWLPTSGLSASGVSSGPSVQQINWSTGGAALTAGSSYAVNFMCEAQ